MTKISEGLSFPILDLTETDLTRVREEEYEDNELRYVDAKQFMNYGDKKKEEKYRMVREASSSLPADPYLSNAGSQIHYLADQINRVIELKILHNNLLKKFKEQMIKNTELIEMLDKANPKVQELEEKFEKLQTETEITKTISEKRKKPSQKNDIGRTHFHYIHQSHLGFTESNPIDEFEYVSTSSEDWKIMNLTSTEKDKTLKYHKSKLSKEGNKMKNELIGAIENYFVKAIFDEYKICTKVSPNSLYKSTAAPFIRFKCQCLVCLRLKTTAEPKSTITVYYYKNATPYFQLQWTNDFPCPHQNPFEKDQNNENKFLNLFNVLEKHFRKDSNEFKEIYNKAKNKQIPIIPAEKMDPADISSFIVSRGKEKKTSKTKKRDPKKPCTSSAHTNIETDENDDDEESTDDESNDESEVSQKEESPLGKKSKIGNSSNAKLKNKKINIESSPDSKLAKNDDDDDDDYDKETDVATESESNVTD